MSTPERFRAVRQDGTPVNLDDLGGVTPSDLAAAVAPKADQAAVDAALASVVSAVNGKSPNAGEVTLSATDVDAVPAVQKGVAGGIARIDEAGNVVNAAGTVLASAGDRVPSGLRDSVFSGNHNATYFPKTYTAAAPNTSATYLSTYTAFVTALGGIRLGYTMNGNNGPVPAGCTMRASIEYPIGTFHRVKRGGQDTWTPTSGETFFTDPQDDLTIPEDAIYRVWTYVSNPGAAGVWPYNSATGQFNSYGGVAYGSDLTAAGGTTSIASGAAMFVPSTIRGITPGLTRAVAIIGDSIAAANGGISWLTRALTAGKVPWVLCAIPGEGISAIYAAANVHRLDVLAGCSDAIEEASTNDFSTAGSAVATVKVRAMSAWSALKARVQRVYQATVTPNPTGTVAAQTLATRSPDREQFNDWLRAGAPIINGAPVAIGTAGALLAGQTGHPLENFLEASDLVSKPKRSGYWDPTLTTDLLHPIVPTGHDVLVAALDPLKFGGKYPIPTPLPSASLKGYGPNIPYLSVDAAVQLTVTAGTMFLIPFELSSNTPAQLNQIISNLRTLSSAGGLLRFAIYGSDSRGRPSTLVKDAGTRVADASGGGSNVACFVTLPRGRYFLGVAYEGSGTPPNIAGATGANPLVEAVPYGLGNVYRYTVSGTGAPATLTDAAFQSIGSTAPLIQYNTVA